MPEIIIYGRAACHLCDEMQARVAAACASRGLELRTVDVDSDVKLARRFGPFVPVLVVDGEEICHYHLDEAALTRALAD